jgi:hypothetical protein
MKMPLADMVAQWERNCDWETGRKIYLEHGSNSGLKTLFQSTKTGFAVRKLKEALRKLAEDQKETVAETPKLKEVVKPDFILELEKERKLIYKITADNRARLSVEMPKEQRKELAFAILSDLKKIQAIWYKLDYFEKHQTLPEIVEAEEIQRQPIEWLLKRKTTLRTYLTPGRYKDPEKESNRIRIEEYRSELEKIETELKAR